MSGFLMMGVAFYLQSLQEAHPPARTATKALRDGAEEPRQIIELERIRVACLARVTPCAGE